MREGAGGRRAHQDKWFQIKSENTACDLRGCGEKGGKRLNGLSVKVCGI